MGNVLDVIYIKEFIDAEVSVSSNYESPSLDISGREGEFSIQLVYDNGTSVNMTLWLEISNDNINFARIADSDQAITDSSGSHMWDVGGTGATYSRITIDVTAGSIDINSLVFKGKRRH